MEAVFREVIQVLMENQSLQTIVSGSTLNAAQKSILLSAKPCMTAINSVLLIETLQSAVWNALNFPSALVFPQLSSLVICGHLSDEIHQPTLPTMLLSNLMDETQKQFWSVLSICYMIPITIFLKEKAAGSELKMKASLTSTNLSETT